VRPFWRRVKAEVDGVSCAQNYLLAWKNSFAAESRKGTNKLLGTIGKVWR
jgi:hypothetical protein